MKQRLLVLLTISMIAMLTACGSGSETKVDENGNTIITTAPTYKVKAESLPCTMEYNGEDITLEDISFYQDYSDSMHDYALYILITIDVSNLDEDQQY